MRLRKPGNRIGKLTLGPVDPTGTTAEGEAVIGAPLTLANARKLAVEVQRQREMGRDVFTDPSLRQSSRQQRSIAAKWIAFAERGVEPTCFLYRQYDARGDLLYVGMTLHLVVRQSNHVAKSAWANAIYQIVVEPFESRDELLEAEKAAIATEFPKFNKSHNGRRHDVRHRGAP